MRENETTVEQIQTDPLCGWKSFSSLLLGAAIAMLFGIYTGAIFYSVLIFFPIKKLISGILDNNTPHFTGGLIALILFPILQSSEPLLAAKIQNKLQSLINVSPAVAIKVATYVILSGLFLFLYIIASYVGKLFPNIGIPIKIHKCIMFLLFLLSLILGLWAAVAGIQYCDGKFIWLPTFLSDALPVIAVVSGIIAMWKAFKLLRNATADGNAKTNAKHTIQSSVKLDDVAGMEVAKEQIRLRLIEPVKNPAQAKKYGLKAGGGVLLYGPPGTGKTFLARAVAGELDLPFYMITAADIFAKYVGESENKIKGIFQEARKNPLSVVFIDEMEIIFAKRTSDIHEVTQKVISVILQEMDGVEQNKNPILLLGATNTPWKIDEAFLRPGRFDILAFVDLPDTKARLQILRSAFKQGALEMEENLLEYIANNTNSYSGADLNGLVSRIRQQAYSNKEKMYTKQLAYEIMKQTNPASNRELMENIRRWEAEKR